MDKNEAMQPATKGDVEEVAAIANKQFSVIENKIDTLEKKVDTLETKMDVTSSDVKLILSAIENLSGQIADAKQGSVSILDYARLETRVEALEKKAKR